MTPLPPSSQVVLGPQQEAWVPQNRCPLLSHRVIGCLCIKVSQGWLVSTIAIDSLSTKLSCNANSQVGDLENGTHPVMNTNPMCRILPHSQLWLAEKSRLRWVWVYIATYVWWLNCLFFRSVDFQWAIWPLWCRTSFYKWPFCLPGQGQSLQCWLPRCVENPSSVPACVMYPFLPWRVLLQIYTDIRDQRKQKTLTIVPVF